MHSAERVLDEHALSFFRQHNYCVLDDCISPALADAWSTTALMRRGINRKDRSTWPHGLHFLTGSHATVDLSDLAPRAFQAACELVGGLQRLDVPIVINDTMVLNTDVGEGPWESPAMQAGGWHVDGDYNHFLDSPESGLMVIINFTEVHERGGATWIAPDSIGPVARVMAEHPQGISAHDLNLHNRLFPRCHHFVPLSGPAGRIFLMHPFMLHSVSSNELRCFRAIRNLGLPLNAPMQFDPRRQPLSEVEQATLRALGCSRLDFEPPPPDMRHPTDHDTGVRRPSVTRVSPDERRQSVSVDAAALRLMQTRVASSRA